MAAFQNDDAPAEALVEPKGAVTVVKVDNRPTDQAIRAWREAWISRGHVVKRPTRDQIAHANRWLMTQWDISVSIP